jgi:uncharacterized protein
VAENGGGAKDPLRIWALLGARPGDNDQVIALAEALGMPFEIRRVEYNPLHTLGPRLLGRSLASLRPASREAILQEPPPDLTISTGHRSVPVVRALRRRSKGRTRSIHVGFPRVSPDNFDLVIATPQYPIRDHQKLLRIPYALTRAAIGDADGEELAGLPGPRWLLIVGGPTLFWNLDNRLLLRTLEAMLEEAQASGGSVVATTSPRTPASLAGQIASMLAYSKVPTVFARPGEKPNYETLLAAADSIRVTADSVSMISDAIWTGKPLAIVPIAKSPLGKWLFAFNDRLRPGSRIYPQDLRFFWRALADIGISDRLAVPRTSSEEVMAAVKASIGPLIA